MLRRQDGCQCCEEVLCVLLVMKKQWCRSMLSSLAVQRPINPTQKLLYCQNPTFLPKEIRATLPSSPTSYIPIPTGTARAELDAGARAGKGSGAGII